MSLPVLPHAASLPISHYAFAQMLKMAGNAESGPAQHTHCANTFTPSGCPKPLRWHYLDNPNIRAYNANIWSLQLNIPLQSRHAHQDFAESLRQMVIEETDGGRRIIQAVASIMDGDAHNCTPWHQLEAAKFLNKLGSGDPQAILNSVRKQSRNAAPADTPPPTKVEDNSDHSCDIKHTQESSRETNSAHPAHQCPMNG